jgi:hypothetical protein
MRRYEHVNVPAAFADCALRDTVPFVQVEEIEERRRQLNLALPEDVMSTDSAPELDALHDDRPEVAWLPKIQHPPPLARNV